MEGIKFKLKRKESSPGGIKCIVLQGSKQEAKSRAERSSLASGLGWPISDSTERGLRPHGATTCHPEQPPSAAGRSKKGEGGHEEARQEGQTKTGKGNLCLQPQVHYPRLLAVSGTGRSLCQTHLDPVNENYFLFAEPVPHAVF